MLMKKIFTLIALACMAVSVNAQNTYILNINKIYEDAAAKTGACANATLNDGSTTKYLLNDATRCNHRAGRLYCGVEEQSHIPF